MTAVFKKSAIVVFLLVLNFLENPLTKAKNSLGHHQYLILVSVWLLFLCENFNRQLVVYYFHKKSKENLLPKRFNGTSVVIQLICFSTHRFSQRF